MNEVVERVARAVAEAARGFDAPPKHQLPVLPHHYDIARAAIAELREPTEGMIGAHEAVCVFRSQDEREDYRENLREAWATMIDAALSDGDHMKEQTSHD